MQNDSLSVLFAAARKAIDRSALRRYRQSRGITSATQDTTAVDAEFVSMSPLRDEALRQMSIQVVDDARGRVIDASHPFPAVIWTGGAIDTNDGREFTGELQHFVRLLKERARATAPKREGWVIEPVTNKAGRRTNLCTTAMHALFLDCDGTGSWAPLLNVLNQHDYAYVAYQSGGWAADKPKWRVCLPLHRTHDTSTESGRRLWKTLYNHARVVFGAAGWLSNVGFDPATETPCCPWFLTEKRDEKDPERQVLWRAGHTIDLTAMALSLPDWEDDEQHDDSDGEHAAAPRVALGDERTEEIVAALAAATARVPSGRRDIYMSLPGVLLDRGLSSDKVLEIIEEVSARYPRAHSDKHADNIHCAKTTIAKWEQDGTYTRIGTLQSVAPEVAAAVDDVLPNGDERFRLMALAYMEGQSIVQEVPSVPDAAADEDGDIVEDWLVPVTNSELRKKLVSLRRKKRNAFKKDSNLKFGIHSELLDRVLEHKPLCAPVEDDACVHMSAKEMIPVLGGLFAFKLPKNTPFDAIREIVRTSFTAMLPVRTAVEPWFEMLQKNYLKSLSSRLEQDAKQAEEKAADLAFSKNLALNGGKL